MLLTSSLRLKNPQTSIMGLDFRWSADIGMMLHKKSVAKYYVSVCKQEINQTSELSISKLKLSSRLLYSIVKDCVDLKEWKIVLTLKLVISFG